MSIVVEQLRDAGGWLLGEIRTNTETGDRVGWGQQGGMICEYKKNINQTIGIPGKYQPSGRVMAHCDMVAAIVCEVELSILRKQNPGRFNY